MFLCFEYFQFLTTFSTELSFLITENVSKVGITSTRFWAQKASVSEISKEPKTKFCWFTEDLYEILSAK